MYLLNILGRQQAEIFTFVQVAIRSVLILLNKVITRRITRKYRANSESKTIVWVLVGLQRELDTGIAMNSNKWQKIDTLSEQCWLNDGNVYEETEVIFCDEYGAYCGLVKSGDMPEVWVTFEPTDRNPTYWMQLPPPPV